MTQTTLGILITLFLCCGWPLIVYFLITWIRKRDWSASGDLISKFFASLHKDEDE
jgi:hypothetical protein